MYERFTDRARKVMQLANQEAQRFNHEYIGTEHILLGLVKEGSGTAAAVLKNLDVDLRKIRLEIEKIVQRAPDMVSIGKLPQTPGAKRAIEYSMERARHLNHNYVGTEHLLLGLLKEQEGAAAQVLMNLGLKLDDVQEEVLNLLGHGLEDDFRSASSDSRHSSKRRTPAIDSFGRDLTVAAASNQIRPVVGRDHEIGQLIRVLCRQNSNSALLLGPRGAGKLSIACGLAQRIATGQVPERLTDCRVVLLDVVKMVAGTKYRGDLEKRIEDVTKEGRRSKNIVLVFRGDELVRLADVDRWSVMALIQAAGSDGLQFIATASEDLFEKESPTLDLIDVAATTIEVSSPTIETVREVLFAQRDGWESYHKVVYSDEALEAAAQIAADHVDGAISFRVPTDLLDSCGASANASPLPDCIQDFDDQIAVLDVEKEEAVANQNFDQAAQKRDQAEKLKKQRENQLRSWREGSHNQPISADAVYSSFAEMAGVTIDELHADSKPTFTPDQLYRAEYARVSHRGQSRPSLSAVRDLDGVATSQEKFERLQIESVFQSQVSEIEPGLAFVLLPHTDEFQAIFDQAIAPALEEHGLRAIKADDIYKPGLILAQVWSYIRSAQVIIADMSSINPNVVFELGLCHGLHRCPILLVRDPAELPFNLRSLRYIEYENSISGVPELTHDLSRAVGEFLAVTGNASQL